MKRVTKAIALVITLPLLMFAIQYFITYMKQPDILFYADGKLSSTSYIEEGHYYELAGNMHAFPGQILDPEAAKGRIDYTHITSLPEAKSDEFLVGDSYVGTLYFAVNLVSSTEFTLWMPPEFTECRLYANGKLLGETATWESNHPAYPRSFTVTLPADNKGYYDIVMQFISHKDYVNTASSHMLIGMEDMLKKFHDRANNISIIFSTFIVLTIILTLEQIIAFKVDIRLISFTLLSLATLIIISVDDERIVSMFLTRLPFEVGLFVEAVMPPFFLLALLTFTYSMYPENFSKKLQAIFAGSMIIPLLNGITLFRYPVLDLLAKGITIIPYVMCIYIFIMTFDKDKKHVLVYGLGILCMESSVLLAYATSDFAIPSRYTYIFGYCIFAFMMVAIIAGEYNEQAKSEMIVSRELSKKLEAMQESENAFLNAQMKPHFLYNTLNTICDCCVTDSEKAKSLITSLSEYLKLILSLNNMDKTVSLERELELAAAYTAIEKERFPSINFYNEFPLIMPEIMMPPITLQPLIENAIKHGVRKLDKPGIITLRIIDNGDEVEFLVSDNGVGMSEETIEKLFRVPKANQSIGIYNINKRLHNVCDTGLKVESTIGLGTSVSFTIRK